MRIVLFLAAAPLYAMAGEFPEFFRHLAREMANHRTVVPICSAVGFAYVLKLTGCDRHLVHLLLRPLRRVRPLLIPGGIAAGYCVNMAVVSQAGSAAVLGPVLIPLLRAGGVSSATCGALLLLGCSMGGELYNPGAVEVVTLAGLTDTAPAAVVARTAPPNLIACAPALLAFWGLSLRRGRRDDADPVGPAPGAGDGAPFRVNPAKAVVPLVPLALLFAAPNLLPPPPGIDALSAAARHDALERTRSATILVAMLVGVAAAGLTSRREAGGLATAFFDGAGYGFTHVISLIVTAATFADGLAAVGLIDALAAGLAHLDASASLLVSIVLPWALASVSGSGIAPAVAVMKALVPQAQALGFVPVRLGTIIALSAHFGRTMSPVAAVVFMCAKLSGAPPGELVRRVAPALLVGGTVLFVAAWLRMI